MGSWLRIAHNLGIPVGVFPKLETHYVNQPRNKVENCTLAPQIKVNVSENSLLGACFPHTL